MQFVVRKSFTMWRKLSAIWCLIRRVMSSLVSVCSPAHMVHSLLTSTWMEYTCKPLSLPFPALLGHYSACKPSRPVKYGSGKTIGQAGRKFGSHIHLAMWDVPPDTNFILFTVLYSCIGRFCISRLIKLWPQNMPKIQGSYKSRAKNAAFLLPDLT